MSSRKNTKFNKNTGYKDFSFSRTKLNNNVYNKITHSKDDNYQNTLESNTDIPHKD